MCTIKLIDWPVIKRFSSEQVLRTRKGHSSGNKVGQKLRRKGGLVQFSSGVGHRFCKSWKKSSAILVKDPMTKGAIL